MLKAERQRKILQEIESSHQVVVQDLVVSFGVSEMTIRRDLNELSERGLIQRTHGGAITLGGSRHNIEPPALERTLDQSEEKKRIGKAVAEMIHDGEKIFLGSGTTTLAVAQALYGRRNITVITNALSVANELVSSPGITVVVVGGFLRRSELSLIGHFTEAMLKNLYVDKVIIGIRGIDPDHGLTSDHLQELITDQAIMSISKTVIVVADHTKFGQVGAIRTAPVTAVQKIVSDHQAPYDLAEAIRVKGVEVILV